VIELISVIVTTYNREDALAAVLHGLSRQTDRGFEIIVADDGSGPATARIVERWRARLPMRVEQVWHEHREFRAAEIRNRGIRASNGAYCIFLDGDCIPRPDFVAAHRRLAEPGWFVTGNRMLLSPAFTDRVLREGIEVETWSLAAFFAQCGIVNRRAPALTLPLGPLRKLRARAWRGARSCNLAIWRSDLDQVDGFAGAYSGWGLEDSDIIVRLIRNGTWRKDGRFATGVLHLWHPPSDRARLPENQARLDEIIRSDSTRALQGLSTIGQGAQLDGETDGLRQSG
jgi:glycosyltransferase involved in cell wall biosynthesis